MARLDPDQFPHRLKHYRNGVFWTGVVLAVIGALLVIFPVIGSITTKVVIGWFFLVAGVGMLWMAFQARSWESALGTGAIAALHVALGVYLAFFPLTGLIGLTVLMGIVFALQGGLEISVALQNKSLRGWVIMMLSGVASLGLAVLLVLGLPGTALWALGLLVGINLFTTGIGFIALARTV